MKASIGVDGEGYVLNDMHRSNIKSPWLDVVEEAIEIVKKGMKGRVHSIYINGSVGRGNARKGFSDVDFTVVLNSDVSKELEEDFLDIGRKLTSKYPFVREVSFDLGSIEEVLDEKNLNSWGFWLKCCCYILEGDDLGKRFTRFKPSREIALGVNGIISEWLEKYRKLIEETEVKEEIELYCQQIMKKIIRAGFSSVAEKEGAWTGDVEISYGLFKKHYPKKEDEIDRAYRLIGSPVYDKGRILGVIEDFKWLEI